MNSFQLSTVALCYLVNSHPNSTMSRATSKSWDSSARSLSQILSYFSPSGGLLARVFTPHEQGHSVPSWWVLWTGVSRAVTPGGNDFHFGAPWCTMAWRVPQRTQSGSPGNWDPRRGGGRYFGAGGFSAPGVPLSGGEGPIPALATRLPYLCHIPFFPLSRDIALRSSPGLLPTPVAGATSEGCIPWCGTSHSEGEGALLERGGGRR